MSDEGNRPTTSEPAPDESGDRLRHALDPDVFDAIADPSAPDGTKPADVPFDAPPPGGGVACDRCGKHVDPYYLFWDKGEHVCLECMESRGKKSIALKPTTVMALGASALFLIMLIGGTALALSQSYRITPAYALDEVRGAIGDRDTSALQRHVDLPALNAQIDAVCHRYEPNPLEMPVYMSSTVIDGLRCARIVTQSGSIATAEANTTIPGTAKSISVRFGMKAYPDTNGVRWVVTEIANVDQLAAAFYQ